MGWAGHCRTEPSKTASVVTQDNEQPGYGSKLQHPVGRPQYAHQRMLTVTAGVDMTLWEWIDFYGDGLGAVAGISAALVAILALVSAASDSRARSQPMITAELRPAVDSDTSADLVITNVGPTPARCIDHRG